MESKYGKSAVLSALAVGSLAFAATALLAQAPDEENESEEKAAPTEDSSAVELIALADNLAALAIDRGDAGMLLQAARLKASVPSHAAETDVETGEPGESAEDKDTPGHDLSVEALLDRAEVLAQGDEAMLAMIGEARQEAARTRGRSEGPGVSQRRVEAYSTNRYTEVFRGGEPAIVWLAGDGDTDLDLYIYDENNNVLCRAIGLSDREVCQWNPRWTGPFRIEVRNLGRVWNAYTLTTN